MARSDIVRKLFELVGPEEVIHKGEGWPSLATVRTPAGAVPVAVHIGPIGSSGRGRDDVERRFQNVVRGGSPIPVQTPDGFLPLLLGLWHEDPEVAVPRPVVVAMEVTEHRTRGVTRQSFFSPLWLLQQAAERGWAEHTSATGEKIVAFWPELLPIFVALEFKGADVPADEMAGIVGASGALAGITETPRKGAASGVRARPQSPVRSAGGERVRRLLRDVWVGRWSGGRRAHLPGLGASFARRGLERSVPVSEPPQSV